MRKIGTPPHEWQEKINEGNMLFTEIEEPLTIFNNQNMPLLGNGYLGTLAFSSNNKFNLRFRLINQKIFRFNIHKWGLFWF